MDEFRFSIESDPKEYVARLGKMFNIDVLRQGMEGTAMIEYANMTLAAQKLLMTPNAYRLCLMEAEAGPYKMCKSHGWEPERLGNTLCHKASDAVPLPILTKLRSKDWRPLQHRVENARAAILPTSVVGRMLIEH